MSFATPFVVPAASDSRYTIVLLHGRDDTGFDFADGLFSSKTSLQKSLSEHLASRNVKWIFPSAHPRMSTTFRVELDEWFDIYSLSDPCSEQDRQVKGLEESINYLHTLIEHEVSLGTPASNIFLGGISQGFATAIHVLLSGQYQLAGFLGFCGWIPFSNYLKQINKSTVEETAEAIKSFYGKQLNITATTKPEVFRTLVFISHCHDDSTVESALGEEAVSDLERLGFNVEAKFYDKGGHWINEPEGHDDILRFVQSRMRE